jgi:uncharacterized protein with PQ loop repeat
MNMIEPIGWTSSGVLLLTLIRQAHTQWRTKATAGVLKWLFAGQITASSGYIAYSFLLHNWVYVSSSRHPQRDLPSICRLEGGSNSDAYEVWGVLAGRGAKARAARKDVRKCDRAGVHSAGKWGGKRADSSD